MVAPTKSTAVGKAVHAFVKSLGQRNVSVHTIKAYSGDLDEFASYAGARNWKQIGRKSSGPSKTTENVPNPPPWP